MKDNFMFFRNMRDIIKSVPRELQLDLREAIEDYVFDGIEPDDWAFKAIIQSIKPSLEYTGRGAPKGNQNAKKDEIEEIQNNSKQIKQKKQLIGIDLIETKKQEAETEAEAEVIKKDNLTVIQKKQNFQKPTFEEVQAYCQERNNGVDVKRWYDYYTANGWKVGKNPMKDWRAAVRTWERGSVAAPASRKTADEDFYAQLNALGN
jgi:hypothetical protein